MWAYLFRQLISFCLRHPHQFLAKGVDLPLRRGFFWVDCRFFIKGSLVKVDKVSVGPLSSGGTVSSVMSHLSALEAGVIGGSGSCLSDAVSRVSSLSSPLVWGPSVAEVHWYGSVVKGRGCRRRVYRRCPVSNGVPVGGGVRQSPPPHILLGALEELLRLLPSLLGCVSPVPGV